MSGCPEDEPGRSCDSLPPGPNAFLGGERVRVLGMVEGDREDGEGAVEHVVRVREKVWKKMAFPWKSCKREQKKYVCGWTKRLTQHRALRVSM